VDPKSAKYAFSTPYNYAGNNPILFVDYDGKDYGIRINHETRTITIVGNFNDYSPKAKDVAQMGVDYWNSQSGKFSYQIGKGDNAVNYSINFELTTGDASENAIQNTVSVLPNDSKIFHKTDANGNPVERGGVSDGQTFSVQDQYATSKTVGPHEMGHNLGADHSYGLMSTDTGDQTDKINTNTISDILYNSTGGKDNSQMGEAIINMVQMLK